MMQGENPARKPIYQEFLDKQAETQTALLTETHDVSKKEKTNFHYNPAELPKGGAKTRFKWNVDAIRTLKEIEAEGRLATGEEQKVMSNYAGWGGLAQAFDERNASWEKGYAELKSLLSGSY